MNMTRSITFEFAPLRRWNVLVAIGTSTLLLHAAVIAADSTQREDDARMFFQRLIETHREHVAPGRALSIRAVLEAQFIEGDVESDVQRVECNMTFFHGGRGILSFRGYTCHVDPEHVFIVHESTRDERYFHTSSDGNQYHGLTRLFFDLPFPHLAIYWIGEDADNIDEVLSWMYPATSDLQPRRVRAAKEDVREWNVLELDGDHGAMSIHVDPQSGLIETIDVRAFSRGMMPAGVELRTRYSFDYDLYDQNNSPTWEDMRFEVGDRLPVDRVSALEERQRMAVGGAMQLEGRPAPQFMLSTLEGDVVDMSQMRGRVVVLDFWATWCGPCIAILPDLHEVAQWASDNDLPVDVIAVNVLEQEPDREERLEQVRRFWRERGFTLPVAMDYAGEVTRAYRISAIPMTVVVRADGIVHDVTIGGAANYAEQLRSKITDALDAIEDQEAPGL